MIITSIFSIRTEPQSRLRLSCRMRIQAWGRWHLTSRGHCMCLRQSAEIFIRWMSARERRKSSWHSTIPRIWWNAGTAFWCVWRPRRFFSMIWKRSAFLRMTCLTALSVIPIMSCHGWEEAIRHMLSLERTKRFMLQGARDCTAMSSAVASWSRWLTAACPLWGIRHSASWRWQWMTRMNFSPRTITEK